MTRPTFRVLAAVALSTGLLVASNASAAPVAGESKFFLRSNGCGAAQEAGRLSLESGAPDKDTSTGCGVIGGVPLEEAFFLAAGEPLFEYDFSTVDGVPLTVDAARDVTGTIATRSWTGRVGGVGEVVVEVEVLASRLDANGKKVGVPIGKGTFSTLALPNRTVNPIPFTFDVPESLQGVELTSISLTYGVHGANMNGGAQSYNGTSFVTVPTLVDDATEAEPTA
jgi:hypothetical protein